MRILNIVDRIFVAAGFGQVNVEIQVLLMGSHHIKKTGSIITGFLA